LISIAPGVWRELREFETELGVLVRPAPGTAVDRETLMALVDVVVAEFAAGADEVDRMAYLETQETMRGPAIVITDLEPAQTRTILDRVAERLTARGLGDARLTTMPSVKAEGSGWRDYRFVKCWFALRGQRPPGWTGLLGWDLHRPVWEVTEADRDGMVNELLDWVLADAGPGAQYAVSTGPRWVPVPRTAVAPMVRRAVRRPSRLAPCNVRVGDGDQVRYLDLAIGFGIAAASTGARRPEAFDWRREVEMAAGLLAAVSDWCAGGHLTRVHGLARLSAFDADNGDRFIGNPWLWAHEELADWIAHDTLVDVHGIMRLAPSLAAKLALTPPSWHATPLPTAPAVLAEHVDPEGWFGAATIADAVLGLARVAAGDVLLDRSTESADPEPSGE